MWSGRPDAAKGTHGRAGAHLGKKREKLAFLEGGLAHKGKHRILSVRFVVMN